MLISSPGTYTLTADVAGGIVITADNVTSQFERPHGEGLQVRESVSLRRKRTITVKNGKVTGFETGIHLNGTVP